MLPGGEHCFCWKMNRIQNIQNKSIQKHCQNCPLGMFCHNNKKHESKNKTTSLAAICTHSHLSGLCYGMSFLNRLLAAYTDWTRRSPLALITRNRWDMIVVWFGLLVGLGLFMESLNNVCSEKLMKKLKMGLVERHGEPFNTCTKINCNQPTEVLLVGRLWFSIIMYCFKNKPQLYDDMQSTRGSWWAVIRL